MDVAVIKTPHVPFRHPLLKPIHVIFVRHASHLAN
jgi:hypothetical protein